MWSVPFTVCIENSSLEIVLDTAFCTICYFTFFFHEKKYSRDLHIWPFFSPLYIELHHLSSKYNLLSLLSKSGIKKKIILFL